MCPTKSQSALFYGQAATYIFHGIVPSIAYLMNYLLGICKEPLKMKLKIFISTQVQVLVEKPTEEDSTIIAVGDTSTADHVNVDDVCMARIRAEDLEELQTSTFSENEYDKSFYDLGNFTDKILSDNEKRQILDMGPLQPSGPFPTDINQNNRCFSKSYYVSSSKYGPVNRFGCAIPKY
ncbi:unnamed protein product [Parnassius apollo]|uniref:(apollo) hypothetical protein n=1 Tax=Parnassius apollo TaxID=110799 RepID=A0A8S3WZK4_PARAO|nr:unnamed protein product [Parnassius apollo]